MSKHMSLIVVWICAALLPMRLRMANVINNPARKTVSSSAGSPGLMKQSYWWPSLSWLSGELEQFSCIQIYMVVKYFVGQDQIVS